MIVNVPTPQALNDVALRLYFSAWSSLIYIRVHFDETFPRARIRDRRKAAGREACRSDGCKGNVISRSEYAECDVCHTCGSEQSEAS
jgi:hypothetical protein